MNDPVTGRTYRWDGELQEDTKITVQAPDGEFAIRTFGSLMTQSNGEILELLAEGNATI